MKYSRLDFLAAQLARESIGREFLSGIEPVDLVTAVPTPWIRRRLRGFNPAAEIAAPIAQTLQLPFLELLRKPPWALRQANLRRTERLRSLRGSVVASRHATESIIGRRILLVDDVLTTGATLRVCAEALRLAGARSVTGLVMAVTPERRAPRNPP